MIDVEEHVYDDDPNQGHPDVRTRLKDCAYFFLGNGLIQAAVQHAPGGEGTPLGLLIMNPDKLRKKREALTFDVENGLENTIIRLRLSNNDEIKPHDIKVEWIEDLVVPAVRARWSAEALDISETFYCPDRSNPVLHRIFAISNKSEEPVDILAIAGVRGETLEQAVHIIPGGKAKLCFEYRLNKDTDGVNLSIVSNSSTSAEARSYWKNAAKVTFHNPLLDHYFKASVCQLPAAVSAVGKVDGSIWQYNREWVRDQAFMAIGLTISGHHELARVILNRLLNEFVTEDGDTIDSSERREPDDVELDQNGILLYALKKYCCWTGDKSIVEENWDRIKATAEFPLSDVFRHDPSGLLFNRREFWERHAVYGIENGMELINQVFVSIGLKCAAKLAKLVSDDEAAKKWESESSKIRNATLNDPEFSLVDSRGFIKRRGIDGLVQETISALDGSQLPDAAPLAAEGDHFLNPDTSAALPIALGFIAPDSPISRATLDNLELLWNQDWKGGGYERYHFASEPDSPGPWPFPSLFVARAYLETGDFAKVWRILHWMSTIPGAESGSWFEFYGPRIAPPFPQVGITPWTWAEMIVLLIHHVLGIRPEVDYLRIRPRFLPGLKRISGRLPVRNRDLVFDLRVDPERDSIMFDTNADIRESREDEILLSYQDSEIILKAILPAMS